MDGLGGVEPVEGVGCLEERQGLVEDEAFQRPDHRHRVAEGEAVVGAPCLEQRLHQRRRLVLQNAHLVDLRHVCLVGMGIQALDEPAMLLHEIAVHQVSHGLGCEAAHVVLGQCLEGLPDACLDVGAALGRSLRAQHPLQGLLQAHLDFLQGHRPSRRTARTTTEAAGGCRHSGKGQPERKNLGEHLEERTGRRGPQRRDQGRNVELTRSGRPRQEGLLRESDLSKA
mmetsp:Transcript_51767/g.107666  ORF Transcript_51767/g.107666 Transcript_51767/m.107666 type:complete len:227 (+) Transcript_51767:1205-1885(+)